MNKQELNLAIAKLVFPDAKLETAPNGTIPLHILRNKDGSFFHVPDYCNNWNDLMPLVVEYKMMLGSKTVRHALLSNDPQLTLAECLLKVLQEKAE